MSAKHQPDPDEKTRAEAAGYIAGILTGALEMVMPVRMWITLIASVALLIFVFCSDSLLDIARATCVFITIESILIGSGVFRRSQR